MNRFGKIVAVCALAAPAFGADSLEKVLASVDASAASFRSMTGKIEKINFTKIISDKSVESGVISVKKAGDRQMKLLVRVSKPDEKAYAFEGRKVEIFYPKTNVIEEYDVDKDKKLIDQFLLLGFSTSSAELLKNYSIKLAGEETVAGQRSARLELVPKSDKAREYLSKAEIWVNPVDGRAVQQKFYERSGDYRQVTYLDAKWNVDIPDSSLKLNPPKGVKRVQPMK